MRPMCKVFLFALLFAGRQTKTRQNTTDKMKGAKKEGEKNREGTGWRDESEKEKTSHD